MLRQHTINISVLDLNCYVQSKNISWSEVTLYVKKNQKRIYELSRVGDTIRVNSLQKQLFTSKQACMLAIRYLVNKKPHDRFSFIEETKASFLVDLDSSFFPRYVNEFISEKNTVLIKLVIQELLLIVLRPEWEARIEENSYGFSSRLAVNQAIIKTYSILNEYQTYENSTILVGKLKNWIHKLDMAAVLKKSNQNSSLRGYLLSISNDPLFSSSFRLLGKKFQAVDIIGFSSNSILLLLANIVFYGLEMAIQWKSHCLQKTDLNKVKTVVCSDHFLVIFPCCNLQWISLTLNAIKSFFVSLNLMPQDLSINVTSIHDGFNFLGFNFRRYPNEEKWNYQKTKLILKPTNGNIKKHLLSMRSCLYHKDRLNRWRANAQMTQYDVINQLNPLIRDFSNYYSDLIPSYILHQLDRTLNQVIYRYAIKKYKSNKSQKWDDNWTTFVEGKKAIAYKNETKTGYKFLYLHQQKSRSKTV